LVDEAVKVTLPPVHIVVLLAVIVAVGIATGDTVTAREELVPLPQATTGVTVTFPEEEPKLIDTPLVP
jgi:hypothetical protein